MAKIKSANTKQIKTWRTATPTSGKPTIGESNTIPDQTLSMATLIERYVNGQALSAFRPIYQYEGKQTFDNLEEFPDIDKMDKVQLMELQVGLNNAIPQLTEELNLRKKLVKEAQTEIDSQTEKAPPVEEEPS